jgi:hypothetical protein
MRCLAFLLIAIFWLSFSAVAEQTTLKNEVFRVEVSSSGKYEIEVLKSGWRFAGTLGVPATHLGRRSGSDKIGSYQEVRFLYQDSGQREGSIRIYGHQPILECGMRMIQAGENRDAFPQFAGLPDGLYRLGFQAVPHAIYSFGSLGAEGPWLLFDEKLNSLIVSPADHFFVSDMQSDYKGVESGITPIISELPAGFSHQTIFVAGDGVDRTFSSWGKAMQEIAGRTPPTNTADILLRKLSYWTDHGAAYFYNYDPQLGYRGTLLAVRDKFNQLGLPLGSMQLDSWFYPKGENADWHRTKWTFGVGGAYLYQADKTLFPDGLGAFSQALGLPLATHARWIDKSSPYRKLYKMSGDVITDPQYWQSTAQWLHEANVQVYEQDWLGRYAKTELNLTDPEEFHDEMARAMQKYGLTMQYCMALPADFMQGSHYDNLTTIRTSHDRFDSKDWDMFLYDSRLSTALGIWPWADVFRSGEEGNLLLATLSAGPVGVGDSLEEIDIADLLHSVRKDGVIVKPDVTIRPLDRIYLADARGETPPMIASSWTAFDGSHVAYVFAYPRTQTQQLASVRPAELGFHGTVYAYDWRTGLGKQMNAQDDYTIAFQQGWGYAIISPVDSSGMAFVGDTEQFVTAGRSRISQFFDHGFMHIAVTFASGEKARTLTIYSLREPKVRVVAGQSVEQIYDNHLLKLTVAPDQNNSAVVVVGR